MITTKNKIAMHNYLSKHSAFPRQTIEAYLIQAQESFKNDPADSDFQRGYKAMLDEMVRMFCPHLKRRFGID